MTELREGLILTVDQAKNGSFTFKGKEIKLEQDKNNPLLFRAKTKISKNEEKAGNLNTEFVYNAGVATGTVNSFQVIPDTEEFKDLNDAEKITKLNSIEYQFGTEPTDDGKQLDHVLHNSVDTTPPQDKQAKSQQQKQQQQSKESSSSSAAEIYDCDDDKDSGIGPGYKESSSNSGGGSTTTTTNKNTGKSGDRVQINK